MLRGDEALAGIQEFRELRRRQVRARRGQYLIEGIRFIRAAARHRVPIQRGVIAPELLAPGSRDAVQLLERATHVTRVDAKAFRRISIVADPSGLAAIVDVPDPPLPRPRRGADDLWIGLGSVRTPGNVGTILRTAAAVGARGVILLGDETDPFDPAAVRASMGAVLGVPISRASPAHLRAWADRTGTTVVGGSAAARRTHLELPRRGPLVIVLGCERTGLSRAERRACHRLVRIPMAPGTSSLNVGVAAGILAFSARAQRTAGRCGLQSGRR